MKSFPLLRAATSLAFLLIGFVFTGCGKAKGPDETAAGSPAEARKDWVQTDDTTPEEKACLAYGRGVVEAVAANAYADFYAQLSSHARARMSLNQFAPSEDDAVFALNEKQPEQNVALPRFLELMARAEAQFGRPALPLDLHVHSSDPAILSGTKKDGTDALDTMFAIGNMPALAPAAIRKASLRAKIRVDLSPEKLAEAARAYEMTPDQLLQDENFQPYLTLKLVLVEEEGRLQVGYFEILPPSMMD